MKQTRNATIRILGVDPALRHCGLGIIESNGSTLKYIASTTISPDPKAQFALRLLTLSQEISLWIERYQPHFAAIEETFVSVNGQSTLKLGQARGAIMLTLAQANLSIGEYSARTVKQSLTGSGKADKQQMQQMIKLLLPKSEAKTNDEADALAIAITHAHSVKL